MKVSTRYQGGMAVVEVLGEVDMYTSPRLRRQLRRLTREGTKTFVVDLSGVDFMDSSGVATLVQAMKEVRPSGGEVRIASPGGNVLKVLELSNLTSLFPVFPTVEEAVRKRN